MHILIIDDHASYAEGLSLILQQRLGDSLPQCQLSFRCDAKAALSELEHQQLCPDLLLLDYQMPGVNAVDLLERLQQRGLMIPCLIISAIDDIAAIARLFEQGILGFVAKSHSSDEIAQAIEHCLQGQVYLPQALDERLQAHHQQQRFYQQLLADLNLTPRQFQVLELIGQGLDNGEISEQLHIGSATVKSHINHLFRALHVSNRKQCVQQAQRCGLLSA